MFKKLVNNIIEADNFNEAFEPVDEAFQHDKISWNEQQMLFNLCEKCFKD